MSGSGIHTYHVLELQQGLVKQSVDCWVPPRVSDKNPVDIAGGDHSENLLFLENRVPRSSSQEHNRFGFLMVHVRHREGKMVYCFYFLGPIACGKAETERNVHRLCFRPHWRDSKALLPNQKVIWEFSLAMWEESQEVPIPSLPISFSVGDWMILE